MMGSGRGLCDLTHFTEKELRERFHNHYWELICPADRERVRQELEAQMNEGRAIGTGIQAAGHRAITRFGCWTAA